MAKLIVYGIDGEKKQEIEVNEEVFCAPIRKDLMHQMLLYQLARKRQGNAATKTRSEVSGGGRKPWRQKGTGRARQGSIRAPHWRSGGIVFGPHPRKYAFKLTRKVRRMALKSAISCKFRENGILAVDRFEMAEIKTKVFKAILEKLPVGEKVLVVIETRDMVVEKSAANLPTVKVILAGNLNIHDLLKYKNVLMTEKAVRQVEEVLSK